jgi:CO/xanthine dehydrogenase FAD-binding subunit
MIKTYHRPESLDDALRLLARRDVKTVALFGFDALLSIAADSDAEEAIDLQAIGLNKISDETQTSRMTIEALARLQDLVDFSTTPDWLRDIVRLEEPNTLRNMRTIAGLLLRADRESRLIAALLVSDTLVTLQTPTGAQQIALADYLERKPEGLPISIALDVRGSVRSAHVARTPKDKPIVAAIARRTPNGAIRLALCGVRQTPVLVDPAGLDLVTAFSDFRGSADYRKAMAKVLVERVIAELG